MQNRNTEGKLPTTTTPKDHSSLPRTHEILGHNIKKIIRPIFQFLIIFISPPISLLLAALIPTSYCINCNRVYWLQAKPNKRCRNNPY